MGMASRLAAPALVLALVAGLARAQTSELLSCQGAVTLPSGGEVSRLAFGPDAAAALAEAAAGLVTLRINLCADAADVTLETFDVLTADATLVDGSTGTPLARPDVVLLRTLGGADDSFIAVNRAGAAWTAQGWVTVAGDRWVIASDPATGIVAYPLKGDAARSIPLIAPGCGIDGLSHLAPAERVKGEAPLLGNVPVTPAGDSTGSAGGPFVARVLACGEALVAVETDYEYSQIFAGNTDAASAYAVTLMGAVSSIYQSQLNMTLRVPFVRVWSTDTDPYPANSNVNTRLTEFRDVWNQTMQGTQRSVAHMLTGRTGGAGGIAWLRAACGGLGYGTSGWINGSFPNPLVTRSWSNWDVVVVAHELGHNFGARHTHEMEPPIDGCGNGDCSAPAGGTIMSYCHTCSGGLSNIDLIFHTRTRSEDMEPFLASASCTRVTPVSITTQPAAAWSIPDGLNTSITVGASGTRRTFQWYKGATPVAGATASTLNFVPAHVADSGSYRCLVSNACSSVFSNTHTLTVFTSCDPLDFNRDGAISPLDVDAYFSVLGEGACLGLPAGQTCGDLDFNNDGGVDPRDVDAYFNMLGEGPCLR